MLREDPSIAALICCFASTVAFMQEQVADLSDEELLLQPAGAPNHAAWTLGHVVHSCHEIARILGADAWLPDDWEARFGYGSSPLNLSASPGLSRSALLAALSDASQRLRAALLECGNRFGEALPGETSGNALPTVGDAVVQVVCAHTAFHAGQLAAWRRAIGKKPVGVFV
jgi:uncharacterized damage-inducible protein DinB